MLSVLCCSWQRECCALGMAATRALATEYVYPFIPTLFNSVEWDESCLDNNGNIGAS